MPLQVQLNAAQLQLPAAAAADAVGAADDSSSRAVMRSSSAISEPLAVIVSATVSSLRRQCTASLSRRTSQTLRAAREPAQLAGSIAPRYNRARPRARYSIAYVNIAI